MIEQKSDQAAPADICIRMGAIERNGLVVDQTGNGQINELHGHLGAGSLPAGACRDRYNDLTGTGTGRINTRSLTIISDRDGTGIVSSIDCYDSITDPGILDRVR